MPLYAVFYKHKGAWLVDKKRLKGVGKQRKGLQE